MDIEALTGVVDAARVLTDPSSPHLQRLSPEDQALAAAVISQRLGKVADEELRAAVLRARELKVRRSRIASLLGLTSQRIGQIEREAAHATTKE